MRHHVTLGEVQRRLEARQPFDANGTLRGYAGAPRSLGWLTLPWLRYIDQFRLFIVYTVQSYDTPIVMVERGGRVVVPDLRHSQTTGRHIRALGVQYTPLRRSEEVAA